MITGEVTDVLDEESGQGKNGTWRKQQFIIETPGQYPKQVAVVQWGDNIDKFGIKKGETVTAHIDIQSREFNGRWYTDVKAWKVSKDSIGTDNAYASKDQGAPLRAEVESERFPLPQCFPFSIVKKEDNWK